VTAAQRGIAATKSEARNPKFQTNSKRQNSKGSIQVIKKHPEILAKFQEICREQQRGRYLPNWDGGMVE
jgi:hypothetical protein